MRVGRRNHQRAWARHVGDGITDARRPTESPARVGATCGRRNQEPAGQQDGTVVPGGVRGAGVYLGLDTTFRLAEHMVRTTGCFWRPGSGASMRLGTVRIHGGAPRAVGLVDGHVIDLGEAAFDLGLIGSTFPGSVRELLELKPYTDPLIADLEQAVLGRDDVGSASWAYSLDEVTFMSPVAPGKVLLVGGNHQGSQTSRSSRRSRMNGRGRCTS